MNTKLLIPKDLVATYIKDGKLYLKNKTFVIVETKTKDTYIEVTYKLD